jgi:hypothetical protein
MRVVFVAVVRPHEASYSPNAVLRDYATVSKPRTACRLGAAFPAQTIDAHHIVIGGDAGLYAVVDLPTVRYHWFQLPSLPAKSSTFIAVGPGFDQVLWLATDQGNTKFEVHITTRAGDHLVATLRDGISGNLWVLWLELGRLHALGRAPLHAHPATGRCAEQSPRTSGSNASAVIHSFCGRMGPGRQSVDRGVVTDQRDPVLPAREQCLDWKPGAKLQRFLTGVSWSYPTITPDGKHLAYELSGNVYLVDLTHVGIASPKLIGKGRIGRSS